MSLSAIVFIIIAIACSNSDVFLEKGKEYFNNNSVIKIGGSTVQINGIDTITI